MALRKKSGRQEIISTSPFVVSFNTLANDVGTAEEAIQVPYNAVVTGGYVNVTTVFNSTTSDVLDVGDGDDPNRYTASPVDLTALGRTALTLTGYKYLTSDTVDVQWTAGATGTATTGQAEIVLQYIVDGRTAFAEGEDTRPSS